MDQKSDGEQLAGEPVVDEQLSRTKVLLSSNSFDELYNVLGDMYPEYPSVITTIKEIRNSQKSITMIPNIPGLSEKVIELLTKDNLYQSPPIKL